MKRLVIGGAIAALVAGGAGASFAGSPGPNGHNNFGLCTAYFANDGNGNSHDAPPFQALEDDASNAHQSVADWCAQNAPHPGNG